VRHGSALPWDWTAQQMSLLREPEPEPEPEPGRRPQSASGRRPAERKRWTCKITAVWEV
jgi:hypothetical protein